MADSEARKKVVYAEDDKEPVRLLFRLRVPSLAIGLLLGLFLSVVVSRFAEVIAQNVAVAFFIPFIVYLAAAVGNQTQNIYIRDLKSGKASFKTYLLKESVLGVALGLVFSVAAALIIFAWFGSMQLTMAVGLSLLGAVSAAPLVALVVSELLQLEHTDPAVAAGPIATVVQDTISVLIYGLISSAVIL